MTQDKSPPLSFRNQVLQGARISLVSQVLLKVLSFFVMLILVRLLTPMDYGTVAMFLIIYRFLALIVQSGFEQVLVQKKDITAREISGLFWLVTGVGAFFSFCGWVFAPTLAQFYKVPDLVPLGQLLCFEILLTAASVVPMALLKRDIKIMKLSMINLSTTALGLGAAIGMALAHFGYWALVGQIFVTALLKLFFSLWMSQWWPRFAFNWQEIRSLLNSVKGVLGFNLLNYWSRNGDNLLVGKFFGAGDLGLYGRAYGIMMLPLEYIVQGVGEVVFPALCKVQDDLPRFQRIYLRMIRLTAFVVFPIYLGIAAVATDLILVVWGRQWVAAARLLQFFCWSGCLQALCFPVGWVYLARGQSNALAKWGVIGNSILIFFIVMGVLTGNIQGLVIAYLIGNIIVFIPCQKLGMFYIDLKIQNILNEVLRPALIAIAMFGIIWWMGQNWMVDWTQLSRLIVLAITGIIIYGIGSYILCRQVIFDVLEILGNKKNLTNLEK